MHCNLSPGQCVALLSILHVLEFQRPSGCSAPLIFPSSVVDRESHTTWLNSHKLSGSFFLLSLSFPSRLEVTGSPGRDCKSTVLPLLMKEPLDPSSICLYCMNGRGNRYFYRCWVTQQEGRESLFIVTETLQSLTISPEWHLHMNWLRHKKRSAESRCDLDNWSVYSVIFAPVFVRDLPSG